MAVNNLNKYTVAALGIYTVLASILDTHFCIKLILCYIKKYETLQFTIFLKLLIRYSIVTKI